MLNMYKGRTYLNVCSIVTSVQRFLTVFHILLCSKEKQEKYKKNIRLFCSVLFGSTGSLLGLDELQQTWIWGSSVILLCRTCRAVSARFRTADVQLFSGLCFPRPRCSESRSQSSASVASENLAFHTLTLWVVGDLLENLTFGSLVTSLNTLFSAQFSQLTNTGKSSAYSKLLPLCANWWEDMRDKHSLDFNLKLQHNKRV